MALINLNPFAHVLHRAKRNVRAGIRQFHLSFTKDVLKRCQIEGGAGVMG